MDGGPGRTLEDQHQHHCYYCSFRDITLQHCLDHMVNEHRDMVLEVRTPVPNDRNGKIGLLTKNFGIVPATYVHDRQRLRVDENTWTLEVQQQDNDSDCDDFHYSLEIIRQTQMCTMGL
jgi:hypothetical protein